LYAARAGVIGNVQGSLHLDHFSAPLRLKKQTLSGRAAFGFSLIKRVAKCNR